MPKSRLTALLAALSLPLLGFPDCGEQATPSPCAPEQLSSNTGANEGAAFAFLPDPLTRSNNPGLSPTASALDPYRSRVTLERLNGWGVLEGRYADVRNGYICGDWFGAYSVDARFEYSHRDFRFQEAMAYHFADQFRFTLDELGQLHSGPPVIVLAHCGIEDNAFFTRLSGGDEGPQDLVCLGDSLQSRGAAYGDDGAVTIHELQHASTTALYSPTDYLQTLMYDEGGALNEAISDFAAMVFTEESRSASMMDPLVFSPWALGKFLSRPSYRGAHRCPTYDPSFPGCVGYPAVSASDNRMSFRYPEGLGWPFPNPTTSGQPTLKDIFLAHSSREEIHNASALMTGALWEVYAAIRDRAPANPEDRSEARRRSLNLIEETVRHLDRPTPTRRSPVTFRHFASKVLETAAIPSMGFSPGDIAAVRGRLVERGLASAPELTSSSWAAVGPGASQTPGLRVLDNPSVLRPWLISLGSNAGMVKQTIATGLNLRPDPGEVVAVWLDLQNNADATAGGVLIDVTLDSPHARFAGAGDLRTTPNYGQLPDSEGKRVQLMLQKVNGSGHVAALASSDPSRHVPTGNTYFKSNLYFDARPTTALWIEILPTAPHQAVVPLTVVATPSNGVSSTLTFDLKVN